MPLDPEAVMGLSIPLVALSIPVVAIITKHLQKIEEIRARRGVTIAPDVHAELEALRSEVASLRDTSTRFDLSFDAAITELERRVGRVENVEVTTPITPHPPMSHSYTEIEHVPETVALRR